MRVMELIINKLPCHARGRFRDARAKNLVYEIQGTNKDIHTLFSPLGKKKKTLYLETLYKG